LEYIIVKIDESLMRNITEQDVAGLIEKHLDEIKSELTHRARVEIEIDKELKQQVNETKQTTGYPKWFIIHKILEKEKKLSTGEVIHVEPTSCPNCGAGETELLISHSDYSYYCYVCEKGGSY